MFNEDGSTLVLSNFSVLLKEPMVYSMSDFKILDDKLDGFSGGARRCIKLDTTEVVYIKPLKLNEWIAGFLYRSFLGDRAPKQALVFDHDTKGNKHFYLCSKSIGERLSKIIDVTPTESDNSQAEGIRTMDANQLNESDDVINVNPSINMPAIIEIEGDSYLMESCLTKSYEFNANSETKIEGMPKIMASFLIFNEIDTKIANILVRKSYDAEDNLCHEACKVDHGYSLYYPSKILSMVAIYDLFGRINNLLIELSLDKFKDFTVENFIESLLEGCAFLKNLNDNNGLLFNQFLNTQFRFLYNNDFFDSKEDAINSLKLFKMKHSIATDKHLELWNQTIDNIKMLHSTLSTHPELQDTMFFNVFGYQHEKLTDPFFKIAEYNTKIEGLYPIQWYAQHNSKLLKELLHTYKEVRTEYQKSNSNMYAEVKQPFIVSIDSEVIRSGEVSQKLAPELYHEIYTDYSELLGCDGLFASDIQEILTTQPHQALGVNG